jgi:hypothetical protein
VFALRIISNGGYPVAVIVLFFVSLCLLAAITIPCHVTTSEATRSSVLIQKLLLRTDLNERIMKDLDRFFTQVKSMGVKFTACGFFVLDMPMFCGIFGAICTFIIVITQLK